MNIRESFSIPYAGSELWISCLDNLQSNSSLILEKILKDEKQICRPSTSSLVIYHLYDTHINGEIAAAMVNSFIRSQKSIYKLAVVGLSKEGKSNVDKYLRKYKLQLELPLKFFDDFELAKEWLVKGR